MFKMTSTPHRALEVITRVQAKLTGRDFATSPSDEEEDLTVEQQVDRYAIRLDIERVRNGGRKGVESR